MAQVTHFEYNARSQMVKVTDALNQHYQFAYDALGRQLSQSRAGATMSFQYDAVGNRTNRTDYSGRETTYEYDALNRLKKIDYFPGTTNPVPALTATYNYDDLSRLTTAVNENGTVNFTYDTRGRLKLQPMFSVISLNMITMRLRIGRS
ncbi:MAG: RHS repeat protein [Acidobacteria bacterium]|nr:RHS repeat protein [Acidobacteriota bacterium]